MSDLRDERVTSTGRRGRATDIRMFSWAVAALLGLAGLGISGNAAAQTSCQAYVSYGGTLTFTLQEACALSAVQMGAINSASLPQGFWYVYANGGPVPPSTCAAGSVTAYGPPNEGYPNSSPYPAYGIAFANIGCPVYWIVGDAISGADCQTCNGASDPINPATGAVYRREDDISFAGSGTVAFSRYYDSSLGGWTTSYSRHITQNPVYLIVGNSPNVKILSQNHGSPADACNVGFTEIQAKVPGWAYAHPVYNGLECLIEDPNNVVMASVTVHVSQPIPPLNTSPVEYDLTRDNGQLLRFFIPDTGVMTSPAGTGYTLQQTTAGFVLTTPDDTTEVYNASGVLQSVTSRAGVVQTLAYSNGLLSTVTDSFGHSLTFAYNASSQLTSVTPSGGVAVQLGYDSSSRLSSVTNADGTSKSYVYENAGYPTSLTGVIDESGNRLTTWGYDTQGRGISVQEAGSAAGATLNYVDPTDVTVTDALGAARTFSYTRVGDYFRPAAISGSQCATCTEGAATTYDSYGWVSSRTDYNGNLTCYANEPVRGLEQVRVEGFAPGSSCPSSLASYNLTPGSAQRKISTTWHATFHLPLTVTEASRTTSFTYDASGNMLTKTVTDTTVTPNVSRTWTYTYNTFGEVLTARGPRTDVNSTTTYTYNNCSTGSSCGQVATISDPVGNQTTYLTYNNYGLPLTLTDPNGVQTTLTYDARARITSRQVATETTSFSYWPTGMLKQVTKPDSSYVIYTYDTGHRLTKIADGLGNSIQYTLDALGNRTAQNNYDPTNTLDFTQTRVYNTLSELYQVIGAANTSGVTTTFGYDANGNQTSIAAPLGRNTGNQYDALNRLIQVTDPDSGVTHFAYDSEDNLLQVTDPRSLVTSYLYNGFGDVTQLTSPDTGVTKYTYDSGGNLATTTDARGVVATNTYDAANRITGTSYSVSNTDGNFTYTYDQGANGKGRLTSTTATLGTLSFTYDTLGRVASRVESADLTKSAQYTYTNGDLTQLITPSGQTVAYSYTNGRVTSISINGTTLLSGVTYEPFGPARSWTWGNGTTETRLYNTDGNASQFSGGGTSSTFGYDNAFRITSLTASGNSASSWTYGYDLLDRLNAASTTGLTEGWTYDANGNRLSQTGTNASTYTISASSNQVSSISGALSRTYTYSASGSALTFGGQQYTYGSDGRQIMGSVPGYATQHYFHDGLGELDFTQPDQGYRQFMYDEAGHLLGQYQDYGSPYNPVIQETIWLGDIPVATIQPNSAGTMVVYYVHTDNLNAPRVVSRPADNVVMWTGFSDPFWTTLPNQNPAGAGTFYYDLRFPGQFYDEWTGIVHNGFRDYDSQVGRYVESDPIGLDGGSASTYAYGANDPVQFVDPSGLAFCWFSYSSGRMACVSNGPTPDQPIVVNIPIASGNNGGGQACRNNGKCAPFGDAGPLPPGFYTFGPPGSSTKPNGRHLTPTAGTNTFGRWGFATHSCKYPFGPGKGPDYCSTGCATGTWRDIQALNRLVDAEPNSVLFVTQ